MLQNRMKRKGKNANIKTKIIIQCPFQIDLSPFNLMLSIQSHLSCLLPLRSSLEYSSSPASRAIKPPLSLRRPCGSRDRNGRYSCSHACDRRSRTRPRNRGSWASNCGSCSRNCGSCSRNRRSSSCQGRSRSGYCRDTDLSNCRSSGRLRNGPCYRSNLLRLSPRCANGSHRNDSADDLLRDNTCSCSCVLRSGNCACYGHYAGLCDGDRRALLSLADLCCLSLRGRHG